MLLYLSILCLIVSLVYHSVLYILTQRQLEETANKACHHLYNAEYNRLRRLACPRIIFCQLPREISMLIHSYRNVDDMPILPYKLCLPLLGFGQSKQKDRLLLASLHKRTRDHYDFADGYDVDCMRLSHFVTLKYNIGISERSDYDTCRTRKPKTRCDKCGLCLDMFSSSDVALLVDD
jgi:hypothetical protein